MGDFEDKLNQILSSPDDMKRIMELAQSLSGSQGSEKSDSRQQPELQPDIGALFDFDPKMLNTLSRLMNDYKSCGGDKKELMQVFKPYLKSERQRQIDRAVEIARIFRIAKIAMRELNGGGLNL